LLTLGEALDTIHLTYRDQIARVSTSIFQRRLSGSIVEVDHKVRGKYLTIGSPIKFSDLEIEVTPSPVLGEHTDEVLRDLGYGTGDIARLHAANAV
jgi:crotonobetainyl-CoA:carnitine CoA-transferase CaiB-like acyl-CoA transferase